MKRATLLLTLLPTLGFGMDRLSALSMIETGDNDRVVGRAGEISRYQILKQEWRRVTSSRAYTNPQIAKSVARNILDQRVRAFEQRFGRPPTDFEFYGLWNAPSQVMQRRVSSRVAERCQRFANLCEVDQEPARTVAVSLPAESVAAFHPDGY